MPPPATPPDGLPVHLARAFYATCVQVRWAAWDSDLRFRHLPRDHYTLVVVLDGLVHLRSYKYDLHLEATSATVLQPDFGRQRAITREFGGGDRPLVVEIGFTAQAIDGLREPFAAIALPSVVPCRRPRDWQRACQAARSLARGTDLPRRIAARPALEQMLWWYLTTGFATGRLRSHQTSAAPEWLQACTQLIADRCLDPDWTLRDLAADLGLSLDHLKHAFKQAFGIPPGEYRRRLRLQNAERMLDSNPELSIGDIARRCGFANNPAFTRAFHQAHDCSPSAWRKR